MTGTGLRLTGRCPKREATQVRVERFYPPSDWRAIIDLGPYPAFHPQRLMAYICNACGFVELYFSPQETATPFR